MSEQDIGVKVVVSGVSFQTAEGDDFVLNSSRKCLKVRNPASALITISGGSGSRVIAHGLSFAPVVIAFIPYGGAFVPIPSSSDGTNDRFRLTVDATNITFTATNVGTDGSYAIVYFLSETESAT